MERAKTDLITGRITGENVFVVDVTVQASVLCITYI